MICQGLSMICQGKNENFSKVPFTQEVSSLPRSTKKLEHSLANNHPAKLGASSHGNYRCRILLYASSFRRILAARKYDEVRLFAGNRNPRKGGRLCRPLVTRTWASR